MDLFQPCRVKVKSLRHTSSLKPSSTQSHSSWCNNKGRAAATSAAKGGRNCIVPDRFSERVGAGMAGEGCILQLS
ncbi:hypothetical protein AV530_015528 [Patagioenas fasciata monilis]|uniref:Uncharacterized protein n=1 Tax=Patagioenas fasciata monilis TaxID=372326 RepID=A0A1V4KRY7_PATFA|nr:hypothetical protein AV530_015528 [Patagioenas fasciata monilis]